jgi:hypothetical protein
VGGREDFGTYLVLNREVDAASDFLRYMIREGYDPVLVSPQDCEFISDDEMVILEPDREERAIRTDNLLLLLHSLVNHMRKGEKKVVVFFGLQTLKEGSTFRDLTNFIGRLYDEACVSRGLVLLFADPEGFTHRELALLKREMVVLEEPEQLFEVLSETVK